MKLLVFAHTPPPLHGQSAMVRLLLEGLRGDPELEIFHVNARLSRDAADIGRARAGKLGALLGYCRAARQLQRQHAIDALYYVPAPTKRSALVRDWIALGLLRRHFPKLVLHWHANGLGTWLRNDAGTLERNLTQRLLGRADLSLVLAESFRADAAVLAPQRIAVVPCGIPDPGPPPPRPPPPADAPWRVLFLGLGCAEKGLFDTVAAVRRLQEQGRPCVLTVAGAFASPEDAARFRQAIAGAGSTIRHVGLVAGADKHRLLLESDCLCLPTYYGAEGQPLVLLEAMAYDLPIVATRWRAIPDTVPPGLVRFVPPRDPAALASALWETRLAPPPPGAMRAHYLAHFTEARHLAALRSALAKLA
jgi:glycosyltransferase involved in cell wall biosynthesis